ncbi:MAG: hypothetical protein L0H31_13140 [Nocardioidaceae bacterium]|nr:hypothetical protein [Nocardioidaceae bacterium]
MRDSGSDRSTAAVVIGVAVALVLAVGAVVVWVAVHGDAGVSEGTPKPAPAAAIASSARSVGVLPAVESLVVLREWDRSRAAAWAAGDVAALRDLYRRGSTAGERDVAMLRRWRERGLRVRGMSMQVLSVELRARTARRLVLVVTDRLVGARAVRGGGSATPSGGQPSGLPLPEDRASSRRLTFTRVGGRWLLSAATPTRP